MKKAQISLIGFLIGLIFILTSSINLTTSSAYGEPLIEENYEVSRSKVERHIRIGNIFEDNIEITNKKTTPITVLFTKLGDSSDKIFSKFSSLKIEPDNSSKWYFEIRGSELGNTLGDIQISGDISYKVPVNITVVDKSLDPLLLIDSKALKNTFLITRTIDFKVEINKIKPGPIHNMSINYLLLGEQNSSIDLGTENIDLESSTQLLRKISFPKNITEGFYILQIRSKYNQTTIVSEISFNAKIPFLSRKFLGFLPYWALIYLSGVTLFGFLTFYILKRHYESKKKYKMTLDLKSLPKRDKKFFWMGKVAEKKFPAYLDPHRLTTHAIVAGATGGGKSITAQVLIEEALKQNISVIVFDPTAQWSGMLRKCEDKKMFAYYPRFGMKKTDARGFPGNIRAVKDARQIIEVEKYFDPGHIQIFTLNKLQPKDMDIFVANTIRQIFKSDPKEYPTLRILLVFDEVHRLLAKFGGSGEGFIQIERACREFRKWGFGVMLISQVLNDFVGEIKANISTEVQMRTRDEGDLNRIKTKFGDEFLQSLVKASSGVGMFVNPAYNHARPYFVNFRPILHNTRRLTDEELEKYNQYNDQVDDLEYQVEQLEELKVDVFDLKMELKLVKDKIMVGNFSVVDIYLEGLKPRIVKQWEKLGKKPKKKQIQLANLEEIKKSVEEAKKEREKAKEKEKAQEKASTEEKKDPMEELNNKILNPLTFDNGIMISSLKELKNTLPNVEEEIFKIHVNPQKNDIATWFEQIDKNYAARLKSVVEKEELIKQINAFKLGQAPPPQPPKPATPQPPKPTPPQSPKAPTLQPPAPAPTKTPPKPATPQPPKPATPQPPKEEVK